MEIAQDDNHFFEELSRLNNELVNTQRELVKKNAELTKSEERLRAQHEIVGTLFNTVPAIVLFLDIQGRVIQFNRFTNSLLDYTAEEIQGKDWVATFIAADDLQAALAFFRKTPEHASVMNQMFRVIAKDTRKICVEWQMSTLDNPPGHPGATVAVGIDVTERIKADKLINNYQKLETLGVLAGGIAHDFNNLLERELWQCICDPNQIGQVIDAILRNAREAMPTGGEIIISAQNMPILPTMTGIGQHAGNFVKISIRDHGIGIAQEYLHRIYDPFFTTKDFGRGLGLTATYSIVKRHQGWIEIETEMGKGTTFHIYLPATPDMAIHRNIVVDNSGRRDPVLIMDDEACMRETIGIALTNSGFDVVTAKDGQEALELFSEAFKGNNPFIFTILDLTIPNGMSGKDAVKAIRCIDEKTIIIVTSGYSEDPVMMNPRRFGFTAGIVKPFRKAELSQLLNTLKQESK